MIIVIRCSVSVGSLDQSPHFVDPYCESDPLAVTSESAIKENLAEAMIENTAGVANTLTKGKIV